MTREGAQDLDPRIARSRRVVLSAALDELAEVGYGGMTIESIARRAGVGKATIYRHWDGKLDVVGDALETLKRPIDPPQEGTVHDRVRVVLRILAATVTDSRWAACMPAIIDAAARDDAVRSFHHGFVAARRHALRTVLAAGVERGELPADLDLDLVTDLLAGPIVYRRLMTPTPFDPDEVDALIDLVLPNPPNRD